jgi:hypothetical protein
MNTRLKIICILFGFAYFFIIGEYIITEEFPSFKAGVKAGWEEGSREANRNLGNSSEEIYDVADNEICYLDVVPKAGIYTYPSSFFNTKTGTPFQTDVTYFRAKIENPTIPAGLAVANGFSIFLAFIAVFLLIYIPVQAYKVIRSIVKNDIFDINTISRIRRIGYSLIIIFGCLAYHGVVAYFISKHLVALEDYKIVFSLKDDYIFLLFGLIILLFAEILKISHTMKEEVDLTV